MIPYGVRHIDVIDAFAWGYNRYYQRFWTSVIGYVDDARLARVPLHQSFELALLHVTEIRADVSEKARGSRSGSPDLPRRSAQNGELAGDF